MKRTQQDTMQPISIPNGRVSKRLAKEVRKNSATSVLVDLEPFGSDLIVEDEGSLDLGSLLNGCQDLTFDLYESTYNTLFKIYKPKKVDRTKYDKAKLEFGRWTHSEQRKFVEAYAKFGKDWIKIRNYIGTRSDRQIRSHAQKFFIKLKASLSEQMLQKFKESSRFKELVEDIESSNLTKRHRIESNETGSFDGFYDDEIKSTISETSSPKNQSPSSPLTQVALNDLYQHILIQRVFSEMLPFKVEKVHRPEMEAAKAELIQKQNCQSDFLFNFDTSPEMFERAPHYTEPFDYISSPSFEKIDQDRPFCLESDLADIFLRQ